MDTVAQRTVPSASAADQRRLLQGEGWATTNQHTETTKINIAVNMLAAQPAIVLLPKASVMTAIKDGLNHHQKQKQTLTIAEDGEVSNSKVMMGTVARAVDLNAMTVR